MTRIYDYVWISFPQPKCLSEVNRVSTHFGFWKRNIRLKEKSKNKLVRNKQFLQLFLQKLLINLRCFLKQNGKWSDSGQFLLLIFFKIYICVVILSYLRTQSNDAFLKACLQKLAYKIFVRWDLRKKRLFARKILSLRFLQI